jgi:D-sedoheptulose 7-phosphate isomerase
MKAARDYDLVVRRIQDSVAVKQLALEDRNYIDTVRAAANAIAEALKKGHKVLFFGNGGSAADAQHLAAELTGRYLKERPSLAGMTLTTNTSSLTAIGNDYSYDFVFSRQLQGLGSAGDVAVGISTSGNSVNVLKAMEVAKAKGMITLGLSGKTGGKLRDMVDYCVCVPSTETPRIQEVHILTGHIICEIIETELFNASHLS